MYGLAEIIWMNERAHQENLEREAKRRKECEEALQRAREAAQEEEE